MQQYCCRFLVYTQRTIFNKSSSKFPRLVCIYTQFY